MEEGTSCISPEVVPVPAGLWEEVVGNGATVRRPIDPVSESALLFLLGSLLMGVKLFFVAIVKENCLLAELCVVCY